MEQEWLNPLNRLAIHKAVKAKAPQVELNLGVRKQNFKLTYKKWTVHIAPIPTPGNGELVPRGYFDINKVNSPDFIEAG